MLYGLSWFVVLALLALWSLAAWALHAVAIWTLSNAGAVSGAASGLGTQALQDWLGPWVPPEVAQSVSRLLADLGPMVDTVLRAAPALASGVTVASWVVWGLGSVLLVVLGAGLHALIALRRRESAPSSPSTAPRQAAG